MTVPVDLPEAVQRELDMTPAELDQEARLMAAARLYERGLASTGKAAELVHLPKPLLLRRLASFGVRQGDLSEEELREDLQNARQASE